MPKAASPRIVTANDLMDGDVIYFTATESWSRSHADAEVAHTPDAAEALLSRAKAQQLTVVGPYLADATLDPAGRPRPVHFREAFRARGPSNYRHGKQADGVEA